jgi:inhibitor of cysteine peptidase
VAQVVQLTEEDSGTEVDLHVGDAISIRLPENPATGYRWNMDALDDSLVTVDTSEFIETPGSGIGGGGARIFTLSARGPGVARLSLKNKRPWEGDAPPIGQFDVTLRIGR